MPDGDVPTTQVILRPYQHDLLKLATDGTALRTCLYLPTGSGKTETAMHLVGDLLANGDSVVWCVNRLEIIRQTSDRFLKAGLDHGVIQANHERTASWKPLQLASIATLARRKLHPACRAIIIDEAHGAIAPSYKSFLAKNPDVPVWGLTATPFSRGLGKVFQRLVHVVDIAGLTEQGWLVPARCFAPDRPDLTEVHTVAGDFHEGELDTAMNRATLVGNICDEWLKRAKGTRTIVFATSIAHSQHITAQFLFRGIPAAHIDCFTTEKDRKDILGRLERGELKVVSNCAVLAEGFDLCTLETMILARPTKSIIRFLQMVGRVLRPAPGKETALILDHSNTLENLGFPSDPQALVLDMGVTKKKAEAKAKLHVCPKCTALSKRKPNPCLACGYAPPKPEFDINQREGGLHELKRIILPLEDRQRYYSGLIFIQREKGYKEGWVSWKYKEKFGLFPQRDMKWFPQPPTQQVLNDLLAAQIRWRKTKDAEARHARLA